MQRGGNRWEWGELEGEQGWAGRQPTSPGAGVTWLCCKGSSQHEKRSKWRCGSAKIGEGLLHPPSDPLLWGWEALGELEGSSWQETEARAGLSPDLLPAKEIQRERYFFF